jgi:hypothetical protein
MKIIEQENPFVEGGICKYYVQRETKTQYVCQNNIRFRKPDKEFDGCSVRNVHADRWDKSATLRIKED